MSQQNINLGSAPNDGSGDTLRTGGQKINENFTELYSSQSTMSGLLSAIQANLLLVLGIFTKIPLKGSALWAWTDKYGRVAMKITTAGVTYLRSIESPLAKIGAITITSSQIMSFMKTSVIARKRGLTTAEVDRYNRLITWSKPDGTKGFLRLERPGGAKVYEQIDALIAADANRGAAPSATAAMLRSALKRGYYPDEKKTDLPTIAVSASNAATSIPGSTLILPTDARINVSGGVLTVSGAVFPNTDVYVTVSKMVGYTDSSNTTPVYAGNGGEYEFYHTGTQFELLLQASGDGPTDPDWLTVDGQRVPTSFISTEPGTNRKYRVLVTFSTSKKRLIRLASGVKIGGVQVLSPTEITAIDFVRPWASLLGDSWTSGTGTILNVTAWPFVMARALGYRLKNGGVGSTGVVQEKQANWAGTGQPLVNYVDPYRLAQFADANMALGFVLGSQNDSSVSSLIWGPYGTSLDDAYRNNLHKIVDAWVAAKPGRPLIFISGTSPNSNGQSYQYFKNRDIMAQVAFSRRKDNVFFFDNWQPLTPWPGTGRTGAPAADGGGDLSSLYIGGTSGADTAHPAPAGHDNRGISNALKVKPVILMEIA